VAEDAPDESPNLLLLSPTLAAQIDFAEIDRREVSDGPVAVEVGELPDEVVVVVVVKCPTRPVRSVSRKPEIDCFLKRWRMLSVPTARDVLTAEPPSLLFCALGWTAAARRPPPAARSI